MHISVVIPAFNEEKYIGSCLDALQSQTQQPDVIYVVDNNSTDATCRIAEKYPNVRIVTEAKQGICAATKCGLDVASKHEGIILRCDADCRPSSDWVEKMEQVFLNNPQCASVTGPGSTYDAHWLVQVLIATFYMKPYFVLTGLALGYTPLFGSNFGIRSEEWKNISSETHLASHQNIHDDMDISYHLKEKTIFDSTLVMPISARPFRSPKDLPKRYAAGFRSVFLHWPEQAPWHKIADHHK